VILDLGARLDRDLEVHNRIWLEMAKAEILKSLTGSGIFDIGVGFQFRKLEQVRKVKCDCVQNLRTFGRDLIGFGIGCGSLRFQVH